MITIESTPSVSGRKAVLSLAITDSIDLVNARLSGYIKWGDGDPPTDLSTFGTPPSNSTFPLVHSFEHTYKVDGFYLIQVSASNKKAPKPDSAKKLLSIDIRTTKISQVESPGLIFGPILPRDVGFPSQDEWCFNVGRDVAVLESNLRLIILTSFGERIMAPSFGTQVRKVIFEKDTRLIESVVKEEISAAVTRFEPRVRIDSIFVTRPNDREARVNAIFSPKDDSGSPIQLSISLNS